MNAAEPVARLAEQVPLLDEHAARVAREELDRKTKPRGSLGRLEDLAVQLAAIHGSTDLPGLPAVILVAAADHGIAAEGVSAYPQEVTRQMLATFASGRAAISVLARGAGATLVVLDAGVVEPLADPRIRDCRLGAGTGNALEGPAMSRKQARAAVLRGAEVARELAPGAGCVALGEMGIGNTTSAAAVTAALTGTLPADVCGPGTGLDAPGVARKTRVVERMLEVRAPDPDDPLGVLAAVGGFEIGILAGAAIGAAIERRPVVLDGFIAGAAALVACRLAPAVQPFLVAAHRSPEPGHAVVLDDLGLDPLLDLRLRLGEGTGAALALPLLRSARAVLLEMATFAEAGVTDTGR